MTASLRFSDVAFRYGSTPVLDAVSLELPAGSLATLIGANGAGKTTLLQLACGTLRPNRGQIHLDEAELARLPSSQRARRIALVPQSLSIPFAFTVREFVGLGRTPYLRALRGERLDDRRAIERALDATDTARFAGRSVHDLSGGERQRVILALALAQEPDVLLLDEPTANLDVAHQLAILDLVRALNRAEGLTVLAAIHDLNLAALCFDRIIALDRGRIVADGPPRTVLTPEIIGAVYGSAVQVIDHPTEPVPLIALVRKIER
ncbi:MAG TPA: ABC transporter ATP-binding protein [Chloroflexota bacterium]|nr:ABC transporter ATP-binding protein [Chloroflexota bacterium]